jgi:recombination protein RecA
LAKSLKSMLQKQHPDAINANIIDEIKWIDTGIPTLNYVISGRPLTGGTPLTGKTVVMYGPEGCGKTSYVLHIIAQAQKKDVEIIYIDTERSITRSRLIQFGVDIEKMIYLNPETMEEVFDIIEDICREKEDEADSKPLLIIWDSVAATPTREEIERTSEQVEIASQAKVLTRNLRRIKGKVSRIGAGLIFINQARENQDRYGDIFVMPGGKALFHGVDCILRVSALKPDESGQGIKISTPKKNRLFRPFQSTVLRFDYVRGFTKENMINAFADFLKDIGLIKQAGSWCYYSDEIKELVNNRKDKSSEEDVDKKFYLKDFASKLLEDESFYKEMLEYSEVYVNKNISLVTKLLLDDEIEDPDAAQITANKEELESCNYINEEEQAAKKEKISKKESEEHLEKLKKDLDESIK